MFAIKRVVTFSRSKVLVLAPIFALLALLSWTIASPVGSSPDDDFHLASIWCANDLNQTYCADGKEEGTKVIPEALSKSPRCYIFQPAFSAACQEEYFTFDPTVTVETTRGSFANSYPPVYYAAMSAFVSGDIQAAVIAMRAANVVLFVALTTVTFLLLPRRLKPVLLGAWAVSLVPLGVFVMASNNPSAWALIGVGTAWVALAGYYESTGRRRIGLAVVFGLSALMAAGSRADSAIYVGLSIVLMMIIYFRATREFYLRSILPLGLAVMALYFFLASGQSSVAVAGLGSVDDLGPDRSISELLRFNLAYFTDLYAGSFGSWSLGWLDTAMPPVVIFGSAVAFVGVVFAGIGTMGTRKGLAVGLVVVTLFVLPMYVLIAGNNFVGEVLQPRYLLPLIVLLAGITLLPVGVRVSRLTRLQAAVAAILLATANSFALHTNLRRYVTGVDVSAVNLNLDIEWWWAGPVPGPMAVWVIGTLAFGAAVSIVMWEISRLPAASRAIKHDHSRPVHIPG